MDGENSKNNSEISELWSNGETTDKIPIEAFRLINNSPLIFDDPLSAIHIILLKSKPEYVQYYGDKVYSVFLKTENDDAWFGPPVKNTSVGLIRWDKSNFNKIYGFILNIIMQEDV